METLKVEAQEIHDTLHLGLEPPHFSAAEATLKKGGSVVLTNFGADITQIKSVDQLIELTSLHGPKDHLRNEQSMTAEADRLVESALHNAPFTVSFTVEGKAIDYRRIFKKVIEQRGAQVYEDIPECIRFGLSESNACKIDYLGPKDVGK